MPKPLPVYAVAVRSSARGRVRADVVIEIPDVHMRGQANATRILVEATDQAISIARERFGKSLIIEPQYDYFTG